MMTVMSMSKKRGMFNKVWHLKRGRWQLLCRWGQWYAQTRTALLVKLRKRRIIMMMLISVLCFLSTLISENRTRSAAFREVNQAARRATALSFYVPILLYISPISVSFIRLISPFFNHSISMWLVHLRALFACCSLCEKVLFEFHKFALARLSDFSHWDSSSQEYKTIKTSNGIFPNVYAICV